ncbi:MAG: hypothetical protein H8D67_31030 [Deltaproteobacteria bacterium]|nr:hypothetical protein [Deltaproteobacteria bacterium]
MKRKTSSSILLSREHDAGGGSKMAKFLTEGVLYYDDKKDSFQEKVERYAQKFIEKTKIRPTVCLVHESDFEEIKASVEVHSTINILPNHLLIGRKRNER